MVHHQTVFQPSVPDREICAGLFFYGILPAFEDFIKADPAAAALVDKAKFLCRFYNGSGHQAYLSFDRGVVRYLQQVEKTPSVSIYLGNSLQTANLVQGKIAPILPMEGCWRIPTLILLMRLFLRFQRLLRPNKKDLQSDEFRKIHVRLALSVALFSLCEIGHKDQRSQRVLAAMPEGLVRFHVEGEEWDATIEYRNQELRANRGSEAHVEPDAEIWFSHPKVAMEILTQKRDSHQALACGDLKVSGLIPLADAFGLILDRVALYLPQ